MSAKTYYVGLDVGGTTMKAAVVDNTGTPSHAVVSPTESYKGQEQGLATMAETIRKAIAAAGLSQKDITAIGVATPGTMDIPGGMILDPPNLKPWKNVPVRQYIADTFQVPTAFQNDANAAALGEYWVGAGREAKSMVLFTLGTGIGGGIILDDRVLEGQHSHGAEIGHMKIEMTKPRQCGCGRWGCIEAYASATAIVKRAREALDEDKGASLIHRMLAEPGAELTARLIFTAAGQGDALGAKLVEDTAFYLAVGAMNMMHIIDPQMVVFGGGISKAGEPFLERIRHHVRQLAFPVPAEKTQIRYAQLGSDAGFIGSAACGRLLVNGRL
jgi:glucokinase